jgi:Protein of unknown function (DUF3300)
MFPPHHFITRQIAILCAALLVPAGLPAPAQTQTPPNPTPATQPAPQRLSAAQLESLVAPIALYPDDLLAQILVASTYPLEIVEAERWLKQNSNLKGEALVNAAKQQNWDPSIQALVVFPDILNRMNTNVRWTSELGNAFLAQQNDVMEAVQSLRLKAQQQGKLKSTEQQKVVTTQVNNQPVIEVEPADPQVVYVPEYNPEAIWGTPAYPYPAMSYPPYYPTGGLVAAGLLSFGTGILLGSYFSGGWGNWGWGAHWGGRGFNAVNVNNDFFRQNNFRNANVSRAGAGTQPWRHNPTHRQGVPYANRQVANQFGRQAGNQALRNPAAVSNRLQQGGMQRPGGQGMQGARPGAGGVQAGMQRPQGPGRAGMQGARPGVAGQAGFQQRMQGQAGGQRANISPRSTRGAGGASIFGGSDRGSRAQADGARGRSSMGGGGGGRGGGGFRGGGGGGRGGGGFRGGGGRGGGGRRR